MKELADYQEELLRCWHNTRNRAFREAIDEEWGRLQAALIAVTMGIA